MSRTEQHATQVAYFPSSDPAANRLSVSGVPKGYRRRTLRVICELYRRCCQGLGEPVLLEGEEMCLDTADLMQTELARQFSNFVFDELGKEAAVKFDRRMFPSLSEQD